MVLFTELRYMKNAPAPAPSINIRVENTIIIALRYLGNFPNLVFLLEPPLLIFSPGDGRVFLFLNIGIILTNLLTKYKNSNHITSIKQVKNIYLLIYLIYILIYGLIYGSIYILFIYQLYISPNSCKFLFKIFITSQDMKNITNFCSSFSNQTSQNHCGPCTQIKCFYGGT